MADREHLRWWFFGRAGGRSDPSHQERDRSQQTDDPFHSVPPVWASSFSRRSIRLLASVFVSDSLSGAQWSSPSLSLPRMSSLRDCQSIPRLDASALYSCSVLMWPASRSLPTSRFSFACWALVAIAVEADSSSGPNGISSSGGGVDSCRCWISW